MNYLDAEAPDIANKLVKIAECGERATDEVGQMSREEVFRLFSEGEFPALWAQWANEADQCLSAIRSASLPKAAFERFLGTVEEDLHNPSLGGAKIIVREVATLTPGTQFDDWFHRQAFGLGSVLDTKILFSALHPDLVTAAKQQWGSNPQFEFLAIPSPHPNFDVMNNLLVEHGFPPDLSAWSWAAEALSLSGKALQLLGLDINLSDYVRWTCTGEPPNMFANEEFGKPKLYEATQFGMRLDGGKELHRLEGCVIWRESAGNFISPLWEYLSWEGGESYGVLGEYARKLADIGAGLDAARLIYDPDFDPADERRAMLTPNKIFRAGEAMTAMRVKMELEEPLSQGRAAKIVARKRAKRGGARSSEARSERRAALLQAIEEIATRNPDIVKLGHRAVLPLALDASTNSRPDLWAQGRGQAEEYLGEIRRGEAGADMQRRYKALFPR